MKEIPTIVPVVAVALIASDGRVLLQKRRADARHGGLWEFPGGKVEPGESLESALLREIEEEIGIQLLRGALRPAAFSSDPSPGGDRHVILLYTCRAWTGQPRCLDGEAIGWFSPAEAATLDVPPLDVALIARLPWLLA
ncbi:MAG TPA: (deoxy)nucleoside triphosphate pyrophosphohydrolase [Novosphingobium sp.]|nr:(deoxy)nucleoside triphosphate pyrophosphohydrolase [Novosphingobium sp.]